ncbi:putative zinc finger protein CONSTANS-LIKE 11 [Cucurbita pepo subsp. pepo]|uniref:putative zinc finger protein CONSTANS-LIKE 11 n=1 Tax=Cucurbita pepo subsp. pepo TaxID=3664 RepID=UPI000C9D40EC|nr:putative zinc finger protein CONSTANS-LIKE 11 [Cucurbita pepo subsp. pepo]
MFEDIGVFFPHFQNFSQVQQLEEFCKTHQPSSSPMISTICEYDMGGEGDLFEAPQPQPFVEDTFIGLDPVMAAISMMSCAEEVISPEGLKVADFQSLQNDQLLNEVYYECEKDLLEKAALERPLPEALNIDIPVLYPEENQIPENKPLPDVSIQKSTSSGGLSSMDLLKEPTIKPSLIDFPGMDFSSVYGMRRAFSEGDIKTLGNDKIGMIHSSFQRPLFSNCINEERLEKLYRYRNKKTKRNFGRKIKYACRKALADSQPRIRGRFAKTDESEVKGSSSLSMLFL